MARPIRMSAAVACLALMSACGTEVVHISGPRPQPPQIQSGPTLIATGPGGPGVSEDGCTQAAAVADDGAMLTFEDVFPNGSGAATAAGLIVAPSGCPPASAFPDCAQGFPWYSSDAMGAALGGLGLTGMEQVTLTSADGLGTVTETRLVYNSGLDTSIKEDVLNCGASATTDHDRTLFTRTIGTDLYEYVDVSSQATVGVVFDGVTMSAAHRMDIDAIANTRGQP